MKCPTCSVGLTSQIVSGVNLDVCLNGCGGIWFDSLEIKKFDEALEPDVETLLNLKVDTTKQPKADERRNCPKCKTFIMMKHFSSVKRKVMVDECPSCAGFWLDPGELYDIRNEFKNEADRVAAAEQLFDTVLGPTLAKEREKSSAQVAKAQKIAFAFRFISPSYYLRKIIPKK